MSESWQTDSTQYAGFFCAARTPYVLLGACRQNELALESSDGGVFTQAVVAALREKHPVTYRELILGLKFREQNPICSGLHVDRSVFSIPTASRITILRVFVDDPRIELETRPENDFVPVEKKDRANVALRSAPDGGIIVERLDGLVAMYASRDMVLSPEYFDSIPFVLNTIAHFNHYLTLNPQLEQPPSSEVRPRTTQPRMELYHFRCSEAGVIRSPKSRNLLRNGVARLYSLPADRKFGIKVTNRSNQEVYPYLVCFDPANYVVQVCVLCL
jgi:hypothetical protein